MCVAVSSGSTRCYIARVQGRGTTPAAMLTAMLPWGELNSGMLMHKSSVQQGCCPRATWPWHYSCSPSACNHALIQLLKQAPVPWVNRDIQAAVPSGAFSHLWRCLLHHLLCNSNSGWADLSPALRQAGNYVGCCMPVPSSAENTMSDTFLWRHQNLFCWGKVHLEQNSPLLCPSVLLENLSLSC